MNVFETNKRNTSVSIAKDRIKSMLVSDRVNCTPDTCEKIHAELYKIISKYIEVDQKNFDVQMTSSFIHIKLIGEDL